MEAKEPREKKKGKLTLIFLAATVITAGAIAAVHFVRADMSFISTENARVHATLFHIVPSAPGTLERFTAAEGSRVREHEVLGWLERGESFRAPVSGLVVRSFAEQHQAVWPGESIAVIADTESLHIQANIEETYIARLRVGQNVTIRVDALGRRQFAGYVAEIGRVTDAALTGQMMSFTTGGTFTKVTQLLPVRINVRDNAELADLIGLNAYVRIHLRAEVAATADTEIPREENANGISVRGIVESVTRRNIYSTLGHMIRRVYVEVGDRVTEGQILGILDSEDLTLTAMHQQAESSLRNARIALETSRANRDSLLLMYSAGSISRFDMRQAEDALVYAQSLYNDARIMLDSALLTLERQLIRSPIDGVVTAVIAREGAVGMGLLFVVEDTDNLRVRTRFREYDIGRVLPGMEVTVIPDAIGGAAHAGTLSRINPAAVNNEWGEMTLAPIAEFEAEVLITPPHGALRIGMSIRVMIPLE